MAIDFSETAEVPSSASGVWATETALVKMRLPVDGASPMSDFLFAILLRIPRFRGKGRLLNLFRGRLRRTYVHPVIHGLLMRIDPTEWAQFELLRGHILEQKTLALYGELLREGDTYVDIGGHIGFHTLLARHYVGATGRVFTIEPQPYNCDCILENARLNGFANITVQVGAIGKEAGFVNLPLQPGTDRSVLSLLDSVSAEKVATAVHFRVPVLSLKMALEQQQIDRVKVLKIDVEGFELAVLDGMEEIAERIEQIIIEILPPSLARAESGPVFERLDQMGFKVWRTVDGTPVKPNDTLPDQNLWASRATAGR